MKGCFKISVYGWCEENEHPLFWWYTYAEESFIESFLFLPLRAFVDARVQPIYGGTNEIMKELIAREIVSDN